MMTKAERRELLEERFEWAVSVVKRRSDMPIKNGSRVVVELMRQDEKLSQNQTSNATGGNAKDTVV